jgi:hypothetical protein
VTPDWSEVLAWLAAHPGRDAGDVVDRWFPDEPDRARALTRVRTRLWRSRKTTKAGASTLEAQGSPVAREEESLVVPPRKSRRSSEEKDGGEAGLVKVAVSHRGESEPATKGPERPGADIERAGWDRVPFLTWQLSELLADLAWVRAAGVVGRISQLDGRVSEVRLQLDQARAAAGEAEDLDETPETIARRLKEREKQLNELEAARTRRERNL